MLISNGRRLASGGADQRVILWTVASGNGGVYAAALAKDVAKQVGKDIGLDLLHRLVKGEAVNLGNVEVQGGIATYNHWRRIVHHEPRVRPRGIHTYVEWCEVVHELLLPNTHQLYIRVKEREASATSPRGGELPAQVASAPEFRLAHPEDGVYEIRNVLVSKYLSQDRGAHHAVAGPGEEWEVKGLGNGVYTIRNVLKDLYLSQGITQLVKLGPGEEWAFYTVKGREGLVIRNHFNNRVLSQTIGSLLDQVGPGEFWVLTKKR